MTLMDWFYFALVILLVLTLMYLSYELGFRAGTEIKKDNDALRNNVLRLMQANSALTREVNAAFEPPPLPTSAIKVETPQEFVVLEPTKVSLKRSIAAVAGKRRKKHK